MGIFEAIAAVFGFGQKATELAAQKDAQKNAPAVVAGRERQQEQAARDHINETIRKADDDEIRRILAE